MTCLTLQRACLAAHGVSLGEAAGNRSAYLAAAGRWSGLACPVLHGLWRRMEVREKGLRKILTSAAVLPWDGGQRRVQPLAGEGDLECLSYCLTSADLSAVPQVLPTAVTA